MINTVAYKNSSITYRYYGSGKKLLLCFHGYGKDSASLEILEAVFGNIYTIVSVDIFNHGGSIWNETEPPKQAEWKEIVATILERFNNPQKFSVFGYSIGGQVATCTAYLFAEKIETLWLMAATGIGNDAFYHLAVNTNLGNALFASFVKKPRFVLLSLRFLVKMHWVQKNIEAFVVRKIDTEEKRTLLYARWCVLKNFAVYTNVLKKLLALNGAKVLLVYGKEDMVVKSHTAKKFVKNLPNASLLLPNIGHHLITLDVLEEVKKVLKD